MSNEKRSNDIINVGKVPAKYRFLYKRSLQIYTAAKQNHVNEEEAYENHSKIVKEIEKSMRSNRKINDLNFSDWKFMIDEDFNFWFMTNDYVDRNFKTKGDSNNGDE